jgi:glucokinase
MKRPAVIGIDLGGTNCRGALVGDDGQLCFQRSIKTEIDAGFDSFWTRFLCFCRALIDEGIQQGYDLKGLGLGFPGIVAKEGFVRVSPNLSPLNGFALADRLVSQLQLPVRVVNDANAIALGEARWGAGLEFSSFVMVTLGTGVGGGLIINRQIWSGADGAAGELGHIAVEPVGRLCGCGAYGCLEQYASGPALVRTCLELWDQYHEQSSYASIEPRTAEDVAVAALNGHPAALGAYESAGRYLGQVLAGIANLLNLEGAVIGGGVSANLELIMPSLREEIDKRAFAVPACRMKLVPAALGDRAGILGAAHAVREMFIEAS